MLLPRDIWKEKQMSNTSSAEESKLINLKTFISQA